MNETEVIDITNGDVEENGTLEELTLNEVTGMEDWPESSVEGYRLIYYPLVDDVKWWDRFRELQKALKEGVVVETPQRMREPPKLKRQRSMGFGLTEDGKLPLIELPVFTDEVPEGLAKPKRFGNEGFQGELLETHERGGKSWMYTINNYAESDVMRLKALECTYHVFGKEVGEQGTPHLQGCITFSKTMRFNAVTKLIKGHLIRPKVIEAARNYCMKDSDL